MQKLGGALAKRAQLWFGRSDSSETTVAETAVGEEAPAVIDTTGLVFEAQEARDVLIIEDEPFISVDLLDIVESLGHNVIGVARTMRDAEAICREQTPELIMSDIQLADGSSGIDAVNELLQGYAVPVIFISAHLDELNAMNRPSPTITISKPFKPSLIKDAINQAIAFRLDTHPAAELVE